MRRFGWVVVLALFLIAWEAHVRLRDIPDYLLPSPSAIGQTLWDDRSTLGPEALVTGREMLAGYVLAIITGLGAAILLRLVPVLRDAVLPLLIGSQVIPIVAVAPILVIYLGFGIAPKVLIVALVCFFPISVNALDGFARVDPEYRRMMRTLRATPRQVFWRVELPFALPGVFSGARIAAPYAAIAALIAETAGGSGGLADSMHQQLDTPLIGAGVTLLAVLALALYAAVGLLERWLLPWATGDRGSGQ